MTNVRSIEPSRPKDNGQMTIDKNKTITKDRGGSEMDRGRIIKCQMSGFRSGLKI